MLADAVAVLTSLRVLVCAVAAILFIFMLPRAGLCRRLIRMLGARGERQTKCQRDDQALQLFFLPAISNCSRGMFMSYGV